MSIFCGGFGRCLVAVVEDKLNSNFTFNMDLLLHEEIVYPVCHCFLLSLALFCSLFGGFGGLCFLFISLFLHLLRSWNHSNKRDLHRQNLWMIRWM